MSLIMRHERMKTRRLDQQASLKMKLATWATSISLQAAHSKDNGSFVLLHDFEGEAQREGERDQHQEERSYDRQDLDEPRRRAHRAFLRHLGATGCGLFCRWRRASVTIEKRSRAVRETKSARKEDSERKERNCFRKVDSLDSCDSPSN